MIFFCMFDGSVEPGLEYITPFCANCMGGIHFPSDAKFRPLFGVHHSPLEPICVGRIYFPSEAKMILVGSVESGLECLLFRAVCVGRFFFTSGAEFRPVSVV